ncbi:MAG: NAD-dependent DNA ligase LigA [Spirochaetaceae bacterium]|nr:NAD-dependent DNA ligase LigA [Spirochaetaceae bacterium]
MEISLFDSARIQELEHLILQYQDAYYNGEALITDQEFDALWDELKALDPSNDILHKVGSDSGNFAKVQHRIPMGSQDKAANPEEFLSWTEKHCYDEYLVEYKLDGASIELQYDSGIFVRAVTRGNGIIGDDITSNAKKMQGVLPRLELGGTLLTLTGGIRGEVIMPRQVHQTYFSDKANCRNAANGLMKRKDGEGCQHLQVICYDALFENHSFADEIDKVTWLKTCGFNTVPLTLCKTPRQVIEYRSQVMELRPKLDYNIDGLVVKERVIDLQDAARARPERQIAFKFSLEEAVTVLRQVEWSESGATYTPVGLFDPVELAGTTVKRASLVNPNTIRTLGVKIGSHLVVTKRGEIIPKIESVVPAPLGKDIIPQVDIEFPCTCGRCGAQLVDEGTRLFCPNKSCPKKILHQLEKWISVLDIRDFGTSLLSSLFESAKVTSILSLYQLTEADLTPFFLNQESISKEKESLGAKKVIRSIKSRSTVSLAAFIAGFDIEGIGETLMERLTDAGFSTLEKLLDASAEDFSAVNGFGEVTAAALVQGLADNREEMLALVERGYITLKAPMLEGSLIGLSFCFTGELSIKRSQAEQMVRERGGTTKSSVVKGLSYLVTNDTTSGSSKNKKAAQLGIPVIDEAAFLELLKV